MKPHLHLLILIGIFCFTDIIAQKTGSNTATIEYTQKPLVPVSGVSKIEFQVFTGGHTFSKDTLRHYLGNMDFMKSDAERLAKMKYFSYSPAEVVNSNADLLIEVGFGAGFITENKTKEASCAIGENCVQYYYSINYNLPTVVRIKNSNGDLLDAFQIDPEMTLQFGNEQIETHSKNEQGGSTTTVKVVNYTSKEKLEAAFEKKGKSHLSRKAILIQIGNIADELYPRLFFIQEKEKFNFYYGKGKDYDYSASEEASETAVNALEYKNFEALDGPIEVWKSMLTESNLEDKKAKVNPNVTQALHENLSIALYWKADYVQASYHIGEALKIANTGMVNTNEVQKLTDWAEKIEFEKRAMKSNPDVDFSAKTYKAPDLKERLAKRQKNEDLEYLISEDRYSEIYADLSKDFSSSATTIQPTSTEEILQEGLGALLSNPSPGNTEEAYRGRVNDNTLILNAIWDTDLKGKTLPSSVYMITELEVLNARNMGLTGIGSGISNLSNLTKIYLDGNSISALPEEIGTLSNLEFLDISDNQIQEIPESIKNLSNLEMIKVKGNPLSEDMLKKLEEWLPENCKIK